MFRTSKVSSWLGQRFSCNVQSIRQISFLGHLQPMEGAVTSYKRLGRGPASGKGEKSGRGQKGQKARGKVPKLFEGGQTPYWKRFPITGFKRPFAKEYNEINLARIQDFWDHGRIPLQEGETLTLQVMKSCGLISGAMKDGVKLLGGGKEDYRVPLNVEASKATLPVIRLITGTGFKYTSVYHSKLGLQSHLQPNRFLLKKGYVPLQARPTHKRDIKYYSSKEKKGYLLKNRSLLLNHLDEKSKVSVKSRKNALDQQLENASNKRHSDYSQAKIINLADL